ncbi:MAG: hypothetical protein KGV51_07475 [Moraxellaceae bacterium]|nr:hypothetical protein [Moraxellaceae bacterium]
MQTETFRISPKLHKAVVHLQALPEVQQEQIIKMIENFYADVQDKKEPIKGDTLVKLFSNVSMTDKEVAIFDEIRKDDDPKDDSLKDPYTRWKKWHDNFAKLDDEWTDADHDAIWDNVRDKNDFGREPISWED